MMAPASGAARPAGQSAPRRSIRARVARRFARPPLGWTSVVLLGAMLLVAGVAIDHPRLVGTGPRGSQTALLPVLMLLGGAVALVMAVVRLPVVLAHPIGAAAGATTLLVLAADATSPAPTQETRLRDLAEAAERIFAQVFLEGGRTGETVGFLLVVGAIAWAIGQFSAWNLARRGLVAPAIVSVGTVLLVIALVPTVPHDQVYPYLVVLAGIGLLLALRASLAHQQAAWRRRHIAGGREVEQLFLRGGAAVCVLALAGAVVLAGNAAAAPLSDAWLMVDRRVLDLARMLDGFFGGLGPGPTSPNGAFGDTAPLVDRWQSGDEVVFTAMVDEAEAPYWRGAAYSEFYGSAWGRDRGLAERHGVAAANGLLTGTADAVDQEAAGLRDIAVELRSRTLDGRTLLSPATPLRVDRDAVVVLDGEQGPLGSIELRQRLAEGDSYRLVARIVDTGPDGLTQATLAAAPRSYLTWVERYTQVDPRLLGDRGAAVAAQIAGSLPADQRDPYHLARRIEAWFAGLGRFADDDVDFRYALDVSEACRPGEGVVDCLLRSRVGFCQQYATAMTLMLRSQLVPARYVQGFLPGIRMADGSLSVPVGAAHAWVEVYFPGHGWIRFDPTPRANERYGQGELELPPGQPPPDAIAPDPSAPAPTPVFSDPPSPSPAPDASPAPDGPLAGGSIVPPDLPVTGLLVAAGAAILALLLLVGARRLRQGSEGEPEALYRGIVGLATRLGRAPRPEQTAYEFTRDLATLVPGVSGDLHTLARAKVEATYARRRPGGEALAAMLASYRRARRALLAILVRRRPRGGR